MHFPTFPFIAGVHLEVANCWCNLVEVLEDEEMLSENVC